MAQLSVQIDDSAFKAQAFKYQSLSGRTFKDVLNQQTGVLLKKLATTTNPFGNTNAGKKIGDKAVTKDVRKVYKTPAKVYELLLKTKVARSKRANKRDSSGRFLKRARNNSGQIAKAWYQKYKKGQYGEAERLLHSLKIDKYYTTRVGNFDGGNFHKSSRHGARKKVPENTFVKLIANNNDIEPYEKDKKGWVGLAKSGWAYCAQLIGRGGNLKDWILSADKGRSVGAVKYRGGAMDGKYEVTNKVSYAVPAALSRGAFVKAVEDARNNMYQFFVRANEALIAKAGMRK